MEAPCWWSLLTKAIEPQVESRLHNPRCTTGYQSSNDGNKDVLELGNHTFLIFIFEFRWFFDV